MHSTFDRRNFLRSLLAGSLAISGPSFGNSKRRPRFAFATLGCPDWSYEQIVDFASQQGYHGVEFRGLQREFDLTKTATFGTNEKINNAMQRANDKNVKIICLGSSAVLHHSDTVQRKKNIDEAKRFIDLAGKLDCKYIRVFGDRFIDGKETGIAMISEGMHELAGYASRSNVHVLLSTHGDVSTADALCSIMKNVPDANAGIGWDILNSWYYNHEHPAEAYKKLKPYIRLVHVKDMSFTDGKEKNVLPGKGQAPIFEGVDALLKDGYDGYLSFVWEKHWFPDIEEPEVAFTGYIRTMSEYIQLHN